MTSILELFRIGIGPSSSHTVGPMRAARRFAEELEACGRLARTVGVMVEIYGSLALTGKGHGTDRAILLGLLGETPEVVDPATVEAKISRIYESHSLRLLGTSSINFDPERELVFHRNAMLPVHTNGMRFTAYGTEGRQLDRRIYYSIGGGFIVADGERETQLETSDVPFPFRSAADLLRMGEEHQMDIWELVLENEKKWRPEAAIWLRISQIWQAMKECTARGMKTEGILPGGLGVRRRAPRSYRELCVRDDSDPLTVIDWISLFAIAVNEENAAGGRVVTAPTNGAAGIIPAMAHYYEKFVDGASAEGIFRYFLTAGAIGILYKENASVSGAEVGCQGEVGVACSMAAGGLVAALGGTNAQVEHAAEIGMEHCLGMTCDPVGGLVQIPCIERNAFGAVKAVNAARMAMSLPDEHKISLDQVIRTMYETGKDMAAKYKETSLGGLALNIVEC
jgi:L-serine dehydratase